MHLHFRHATTITCLIFGIAACAAGQSLSLPNTGVHPSLVSVRSNPTLDSYWHFTFSGLEPGYSVQNGDYRGWCIDQFAFINYYANALLYSTNTPPFPPLVPSSAVTALQKVNYLINHRRGASALAMQGAIWMLLQGQSAIPEAIYGDNPGLVTGIQKLVSEANMFGAGYSSTDAQLIVAVYDGNLTQTGNTEQDIAFEFHCPRTQGYWQRYLAGILGYKKDVFGGNVWNINGLTIGTVSYTNQQLYDFLNTPVNGDAGMILLHQYIAAEFNLIKAGGTPAFLTSTLQSAQSLLTSYLASGTKVDPATYPGTLMVSLADTLDQFNNGKLTPGCAGTDTATSSD